MTLRARHRNQGEQVNHPERPAQTPSLRTGLSATLLGTAADSKGTAAPSFGPARASRLAFLLAAALLATLALGASSALAREVHGLSATIGEPGAGNGQLALAEHSGLAVNQATHDLYVADTGNGRVEEFEADGTFVRAFATSAAPTFIAVDNSPGGEGDVYVGDPSAGTVAKYEADGAPVTGWGTGGVLGGFSELEGVAVGPEGDLLVLNVHTPAVVSRYGQNGSLIASFTAPGDTGAGGLAVDTEGNLYKLAHPPDTRVDKVSSSGGFLGSPDGRFDATGLAIDPANNDLYVAQSGGGGLVDRFAVNCTGEFCTPTEEFGAGQIAGPAGVAVDAANHRVYVASAGASQIDVFDLEEVEPPVATIEAPTAVKFTTAHVAGSVDPEGEPTLACRFEYVTAAQFGAEGFAGAQSTPCATNPGSGTAPVAVEAELSGLQTATTYHLRLAARNRGGTGLSPEPNQTLETKVVSAPEATIEAASALTYHSAHLAGTVELANPDPAFNSSCAFQYISEAGFQANLANSLDGFEGASSLPCEPATVLASEAQPVAVKADLGGLAAGTTYHLRLLAANVGGNATAVAPDFSTEAVAPPSASGLTVAAITATSAHFEATVNAGGTGPGESTATYAFSCEPECPGLPGPAPIPADGAAHTVEADATGLEPATPYTVTLTATSPGGESKVLEHFTTEAPAPGAVTTLPFEGPVSATAARLYGSLNPHNSPTTYYFEYGPNEGYGQSVPAEQNAEAPPGNALDAVSQDLTGLAPQTEYHYRLVAHSAAGTVFGADRTLTTAATPPPCANQQRRSEDNSTQLPDCRAYEMVTPPFKAGDQAGLFAIAADGSEALGEDTAAFAGGEGSGLGTLYQLVRSDSGWGTSAISPPASQFPAQHFADAGADLGSSLWWTRHPTEPGAAEDLYLRRPDGSMVEIGPMVPPESATGPPAESEQSFFWDSQVNYEGASADLSRTVFRLSGSVGRWPGDTSSPQTDTTYEYAGTGNTEPELVGVANEGTLAAAAAAEGKPHVNEAAELISRCSTWLGTLGGIDKYNAISADGETVFFTAAASGSEGCAGHGPPVNELYARIARSHTVAISEPTAADCAACQTGPSDQASAEFQGASRDGSKVFFLTSGELLPGARGENLYEYDFDAPAGQRIVPVSTSTGVEEPLVQGVARVSEDGSHVYFVAKGVLTGSNAEGEAPTQGADNLYVFERDAANPGGRMVFVATLSPADEPMAGLIPVCVEGGDWCAVDNRSVQATPDGRYLVFKSVADLTPGDTSSEPQIFEYDALREELVRVSVGEAGYPAGAVAADATAATIRSTEYTNGSFARPSASLAISDDGSTVLFASHAALAAGALPAAEAGAESVYEYRSAGPISSGDVHLISSGGAVPASLLGLDPSGNDVLFSTSEPLLAADVDAVADTYDARVDGGFPAPSGPPTCAGESCQGAASGASAGPSPATPGFQGPGNQVETPHKHKHHRKHKARKHRRPHHKRSAHDHRRAGR
jgi:hypothetical protein